MITVVVPVYRGLADVRACISSVLRHAASMTMPSRLVVIDDASPEPDVSAFVTTLTRGEHTLPITVMRNDRNLGFPATVNRGFAAADGDVVVLNADTVVTAGWLDRLHDAATSAPDVASVTPLTNFGSICTIPLDLRVAFDLDGDDPRIDDAAAFITANSAQFRPAVISGVGFCMYVTRAALDTVGGFDHVTFGAGYGEEVDWSLRATRHGFRHLVEDATYVHHHGGGSFGGERNQRRAAAGRLLHRRYPFFHPANTTERRHEPLTPSFAALELGLRARDPARPHVLMLMHSQPGAIGGTEKHTELLVEALSERIDVSTLYPVPSGFVLRTRWGAGEPVTDDFLLPGGAWQSTALVDDLAVAALESTLSMFAFDAVHIHNLIGHSLAPLRVLRDFDGQVVLSLRDLYLACPNHWLMYRNEVPCGVPQDLAHCAVCLPETRKLPVEHLVDFRAEVANGLDEIDTIVVASANAADYLLRAYAVPDERFRLIPHGAVVPLDDRRTTVPVDRIHREPLRIAFAGLGRSKKGFDVVGRLAVDLASRGIEVHHFGLADEETPPELVAHGWYDNRHLPALLDAAGIQVMVLPGAYAETFGHVMTEALVAGVPVIGAEYGALGERIRRDGVGWTIDPTDYPSVRELVVRLHEDRSEVERVTRRVVALPLETVADTADRYAETYRLGARTKEQAMTPTENEALLQRRLRALAAVNRQLQAQLDEARFARGTMPEADPKTVFDQLVDVELTYEQLLDRRAVRVAQAFGELKRARTGAGALAALRQVATAAMGPKAAPVDRGRAERSVRRLLGASAPALQSGDGARGTRPRP